MNHAECWSLERVNGVDETSTRSRQCEFRFDKLKYACESIVIAFGYYLEQEDIARTVADKSEKLGIIDRYVQKFYQTKNERGGRMEPREYNMFKNLTLSSERIFGQPAGSSLVVTGHNNKVDWKEIRFGT